VSARRSHAASPTGRWGLVSQTFRPVDYSTVAWGSVVGNVHWDRAGQCQGGTGMKQFDLSSVKRTAQAFACRYLQMSDQLQCRGSRRWRLGNTHSLKTALSSRRSCAVARLREPGMGFGCGMAARRDAFAPADSYQARPSSRGDEALLSEELLAFISAFRELSANRASTPDGLPTLLALTLGPGGDTCRCRRWGYTSGRDSLLTVGHVTWFVKPYCGGWRRRLLLG